MTMADAVVDLEAEFRRRARQRTEIARIIVEAQDENGRQGLRPSLRRLGECLAMSKETSQRQQEAAYDRESWTEAAAAGGMAETAATWEIIVGLAVEMLDGSSNAKKEEEETTA